jgi:hypothetical protein
MNEPRLHQAGQTQTDPGTTTMVLALLVVGGVMWWLLSEPTTERTPPGESVPAGRSPRTGSKAFIVEYERNAPPYDVVQSKRSFNSLRAAMHYAKRLQRERQTETSVSATGGDRALAVYYRDGSGGLID